MYCHQDKDLAKQIYDMRLTERLSDEKRTTFLEELPGPKLQQALTAIADESEFLDPPAAEVPSLPAPTEAEQEAMLDCVVDYVQNTVQRLPNSTPPRKVSALRPNLFMKQPLTRSSNP
jgi:hypothetical protein